MRKLVGSHYPKKSTYYLVIINHSCKLLFVLLLFLPILINQISKLKDEISKKEIECQKQIARSTTISDRENLDLRRRVDKLSIAHMEELEEIRASHSEEMGQ